MSKVMNLSREAAEGSVVGARLNSCGVLALHCRSDEHARLWR